MRMIPQVLRYYLVLNTIRHMEIGQMMDHCDGTYAQLAHLKKIMLHDKRKTIENINHYINELADNRFHFLYKNRREQGIEFDPCRTFEEDIAGAKYTNWELIKVLRELKAWVEYSPEYRYPAEING